MEKECIAVVYNYKGKDQFKVLTANWILSFTLPKEKEKEIELKISNIVRKKSKNNEYKLFIFEEKINAILDLLTKNNIDFKLEKIKLNEKQKKIIEIAEREKWSLDKIRNFLCEGG